MHSFPRRLPARPASPAILALVSGLFLSGPAAHAQKTQAAVSPRVAELANQTAAPPQSEKDSNETQITTLDGKPTGIEATLGNDVPGRSDTALPYQKLRLNFGQNYLRVIIQDVYLPRNGRSPSLTATVHIKNKTSDDSQTGNSGLTFKYAIESKTGEVYSQRGQYTVTPYFAVNSKCPIDITLEERETNRTATSAVGIVQELLTGAANVFTGGAAATVSSLTRYANASSALVGAYENTTTVSDKNHLVAFDNALDDRAELVPVRIALFTHGEEAFGVVDRDGVPHKFKESTAFQFEKATDQGEAEKYKSAYRFFLVDPKGNPLDSQRYYPDGKRAFVVLRFEVYNPHPDIKYNPEQIAGAGDSFRAMNTLYLAHHDDTKQGDLRTLLDEEGKKLSINLRTLTDAGDLSLKDARALMDVYADRMKTFTDGTDADVLPLHRIARTFYLNHGSNTASDEQAELTDPSTPPPATTAAAATAAPALTAAAH